MQQRKIYLHLGMHKTGTTAFQVFCANHAERLRQLGCLYPEVGRPKVKDVSYGHHLLPWSLTHHVVDPAFWPANVSNLDYIWTLLAEEINASDCASVVLSSEEFDTLNPAQIRVVIDKLGAFDVQPIIYLRRLDELAQALYTTDVVYNATKEHFSDYLDRMRTPLDYRMIVAPWAAGRTPPAIRYYDPELAKAGVVSDLLRLVGIDAAEFDAGKAGERVNVGSWPWYVVEVCRQMNACNLPTRSVVVKFAYIMRDVVGPTSGYDIIPPSEAARLNQRGLESLTRLNEVYPIPDVTSHFRNIAPASDDAQWQRSHNQNHAAIVRVLQQISRVVESDGNRRG